jgi:DNA-binding XRE family transcriptional regulator
MAKKKTTEPVKPKKTKRILKTAKDKANTIDVPEDCAAIVLTPDGKARVYISNISENEESGTYMPHEELCIAIAALLQNQSYVETTLKTFRDLFDAAVAQRQKPEDAID